MSTDSRKGMGIFAKMLLVMLLVTLVPTSLIWYAGNREQSKQLEQGINARLSSNAERLAQYTDQWFEAHLRMLRMMAINPDIVSMNGARQEPLLRNINEQYPYIYLAHTTRLNDGMNEARSDGKPSTYYGDRDYIRDATTSARGYGLEVVIGKTSKMPALLLSVPIMREGRAVGVLSTAFSIEQMSKQIADNAIGKTGFTFLLDPKGRVVAHPQTEHARVQKDFSKHPMFAAAPVDNKPMLFTDENGKAVLGVAVTTREGLTLIAQQDSEEAHAPIVHANREAATALGASLLLVVVLAYAFSRGFTNPIRHLTKVAEKISMGEMHENVPEKERGDELGGLARAIDRMGVSLALAMSQLEAAAANANAAATPPAKSDSARPAPRSSMTVPKMVPAVPEKKSATSA